MTPAPFLEQRKDTIKSMRELIESGQVERLKEEPNGWQYGGKAIANELKELYIDMFYNGYKTVHSCVAYHFVKSVKVQNPTEGFIILPVKGTSSLIPGGILVSDSYSYFEDLSLLMLEDEQVDMIFVILEPKTGEETRTHGAQATIKKKRNQSRLPGPDC